MLQHDRANCYNKILKGRSTDLNVILYENSAKTKIVSEYDQEIPQSQTADNPGHREEEPLNHHETPGRQIKQSDQLSLPYQDDCNTRMDIKFTIFLTLKITCLSEDVKCSQQNRLKCESFRY